MTNPRARMIVVIGLVIGALFGMAGTFAPSASLRGLAWGLDGTALIVATALLAVHHIRRGNDLAAAGFLVYVAGETLITSGAAMSLEGAVYVLGTGAALWAASLALVGISGVMPMTVNIVGFVGAALFAIVAAQILGGTVLTPLTQPLPFFAFPFLAATLLGWAWTHARTKS